MGPFTIPYLVQVLPWIWLRSSPSEPEQIAHLNHVVPEPQPRQPFIWLWHLLLMSPFDPLQAVYPFCLLILSITPPPGSSLLL